MRWLALLLALLLAACAEFDVAFGTAQSAGAQAADRQLEAARWQVCDVPTAGALRRAYARNHAGFEDWWKFCIGDFPWPGPIR